MNPFLTRSKQLGVVGMAWLANGLVSAPSGDAGAMCGDPSAAVAAEAGGPAAPAVGGPIAAIHAHVCGFHFYSGDRTRAFRAEHYCAHISPDIFQCVIYDSTAPNARLIGVEYIISEALFRQLPPEEKRLWHSHRYEVLSGQLTAPGQSDAAELKLMQELVNTYGKIWYLWQVDRGDQLPLGLPKLMMGSTADGQVDPQLVAARDHDQKIVATEVAARRAYLSARPVAAGADAWQQGVFFQISDDLLKREDH